MFCAKCGKDNAEKSSFCQGCGAPLTAGSCCCAGKGKKLTVIFVALAVILLAAVAVAFKDKLFRQNAPVNLSQVSSVASTKVLTPNIILMISEQNIEGPQRAWWASEIDLSATEAATAQAIIQAGYTVLEPSQLTRVVKQSPAFRLLSIPDSESVKLGNLARAQYVIAGKAVASAGGHVPQSNMLSCFGNISAKIIRVKDGKVIAYLDASGSSVHMDAITGGKEALVNAAQDLATKIINALNSDSGK